MIHWGSPRLLELLFAIPVIALLMILGAWLRRRGLRRLADPELVPRLTDSRSPGWAAFKAACVLTGLVFMIVAAARPQWGEKLQVFRGRGIDIVVVLDASKSMLATDIAPSRLARAKTQIASMLDAVAGNRVGIVAFAGEAQVMCPLTTDVDAAKLFLDIIDPANMPRPGTNIQNAVEAATSLFDPGDETSKAIVLVTDGDNLDGDPAQATRVAVENHVRLFAVGVGTPEGSTVPDAQGPGTSYKKDADGKVVVSRLGERTLLLMAKATDGRYFRSESINLDALTDALGQIQKKAIGGGEFVEYEERYQGFLLIAFVLLFVGTLASDRRGGWFPRLVPATRGLVRRDGGRRAGAAASRGTALALLAAISLATAGPARADVGSRMRHGLALERQGRYAEAAKAYQEALVLEPDNSRIRYNIGRALYEANQPREAAEDFQLGVLTKSRPLRAKTLYNLGNAQFRQQQLDQAIASYTLALLQRPNDLAAKENLEFCLKARQQQKQPPDSTRQQPPQQNPQPQQQPQPQPQQAQAQKGAISKEQAERMLQALRASEREQERKQPHKPQAPAAGGRDW
ncbi:MAG TPA: VWA domain-containing protein [Candidatus Eisenbacteria bacterium]